MTVVYVAAVPPAPQVVAQPETRRLWLESLDGSVVVPFDNNPVTLQRGALGLGVSPVEVVTSVSPGVEGASLDEVRADVRPLLLPLVVTGTPVAVRLAVQRLRDVMQVGSALTSEGSFRLVASTPAGTRQMTLTYLSGLEGDYRATHLERIPLRVVALDPFARDREPRSSPEFRLGVSTGSMTSADPATAGPRQLASSVVIGEAMPIDIVSQVPVWPRIDVTGPFAPLTVTASTGMNIDIPGGVPADSTLTVITEPRYKSIRLDGALAAGSLARGSKIGSPFLPGLNHLSVAATGATEDSRIVLSWRGGWRSLW